MMKPGEVVTVDFPGVTGVQQRPARIALRSSGHFWPPFL